ncbi:hypothetical protein [Nocardia sp. 348MFTsu5.1]|uniref:hypothetical protein n=1 Tax=Nocardia sp. 348MFTsu5.1 TaxID=1172185 RepID=UPI0012DDADE4|nr:hypothetical protein [Nocardia sp. 348MFTsu5.1]
MTMWPFGEQTEAWEKLVLIASESITTATIFEITKSKTAHTNETHFTLIKYRKTLINNNIHRPHTRKACEPDQDAQTPGVRMRRFRPLPQTNTPQRLTYSK